MPEPYPNHLLNQYREAFYNNRALVEKFAGKVNWAEIINNWNIEKPLEFFKRFQQYIPMAKLQDSRLWNEMISARAGMILKEMIGI